MIPERCAMVDFPRAGWTWPDSQYNSTLQHRDHPDHHFNALWSDNRNVLTLRCVQKAEPDAMRFFMHVNLDRSLGATPKKCFWAMMDAGHNPDAWARSLALFRMSQRWLVQASVGGTWRFMLPCPGKVAFSPLASSTSRDAGTLHDLKPCMLRVLEQCTTLLLPYDDRWGFVKNSTGSLPENGHARLQLCQVLNTYAEADAKMFGLGAQDVDLRRCPTA